MVPIDIGFYDKYLWNSTESVNYYLYRFWLINDETFFTWTDSFSWNGLLDLSHMRELFYVK